MCVETHINFKKCGCRHPSYTHGITPCIGYDPLTGMCSFTGQKTVTVDVDEPCKRGQTRKCESALGYFWETRRQQWKIITGWPYVLP